MFDAYIRDHARLAPRAPALVTPERRANYAEFDADIDRFGQALVGLGVDKAAGVVSVRFENTYLNTVATVALARLGLVSAPSDDHRADIRIFDLHPGGSGPRPVRLDAAWTRAALSAPHRPLPILRLRHDETVRIGLTSGLVPPRRVRFDVERVTATADVQAYSFGGGRNGAWITLQGPDSSAGFFRPMTAWRLGAAVIAGLPIRAVPEALESWQRNSVLSASPTQLLAVLQAAPPGFRPQPQWRIVLGGPSPSPSLIREVCDRLTPDVVICYGSAESSVNCIGALGPDLPAGQIGFPLAGCEIQVLGEDGQGVETGQPGELRIRSNRMATGYLDDNSDARSPFRDGWFYPGDIGRYLPNGRLVLEGRTDDRMSVGGIKFMPQTLEVPARACPGILDCAAFTVPGPGGLEQCWLAVVGEPGFDRSLLSNHLSRSPGLPPLRLAWIDEIPRDSEGGADRNRLREAVLAILSRTEA